MTASHKAPQNDDSKSQCNRVQVDYGRLAGLEWTLTDENASTDTVGLDRVSSYLENGILSEACFGTVGHGLDSSIDWTGFEWIGLDMTPVFISLMY